MECFPITINQVELATMPLANATLRQISNSRVRPAACFQAQRLSRYIIIISCSALSLIQCVAPNISDRQRIHNVKNISVTYFFLNTYKTLIIEAIFTKCIVINIIMVTKLLYLKINSYFWVWLGLLIKHEEYINYIY